MTDAFLSLDKSLIEGNAFFLKKKTMGGGDLYIYI